MSVEIEFLGQSGFAIRNGSHSVVIDPFLTHNPLAVRKPAEIKCQVIALTHGHFDHLGDTIEIAKANDATVHATFELCEYLEESGVKTSRGNIGGRVEFPFCAVSLTQAFHSSSLKGRYLGMPCGVVLEFGGVTIYHCGDTGIFGDMALLGEIYRPDIAMIPIGNRFTMGPRLATRAAEMIKPKIAIPVHYKTMPTELVADATGFRPHGVEVRALEPGEKMNYSA